MMHYDPSVTRRGAVRLAMLAAIVLGGLAWLAAPAQAHTGTQSYIYLEIEGGSIEGRVEFPIKDLNEVLDLDLPTTGADVQDAVDAEEDVIRQYAIDHLAMSDESGTESWPLVFGSDLEILDLDAGAYVLVPFAVDEDFEEVPERFTVTYDGLIEEMSDRDALLLLENDWQAGAFNNEADHLVRFTPDSTTQIVDRDASFWKGFWTTIDLGIEHIRIGSDHILFVLALLVPAVLVFTRGEGWRPIPTFGAGLWRVTKIATMFTVAHSITLTLGGLGIVELPARPVETFIAVSIAAAAIHSVVPIFANKEWILAFCFGLFHGLGFAGLLEDLGLNQSNRFWSLLGFNLGIELGQLVIIFLVFPVLFILRRTRVYPVVLYGTSAGLALAALGWAAERGFDLPERVNRYVEPVVEWPRAVWIILGAGILAAVYQQWEKAGGHLRTDDDLLPGPAIQRRGGHHDAPPPDGAAPPAEPEGDLVGAGR